MSKGPPARSRKNSERRNCVSSCTIRWWTCWKMRKLSTYWSRTQSRASSSSVWKSPCNKVSHFLIKDHHTSYQPFVTLILQYFLKVANETLTANTFHESILSDGNASKVLKSLLLIQQPFIDFYCDEFAKLFIKHLKTVLESRASFILLGILEKGGRDHLVKEIVKSGVGFDKCIAGQHFLKLINGSTGKEFQQQQPHGQKKYDGKKKWDFLSLIVRNSFII